jgi:nucleoside phosphorylase/tetratricopeptide (TPR) repeat protein
MTSGPVRTTPVIVVLTALEVEHHAVRQSLVGCRRADHPSGTVFEVGRSVGSRSLVALAVTGEGNAAAAILAERAIMMFQPRALILVGVAGALHNDLQLGDVVVATKVYAYHGGSAQPDGFLARPRAWETPHQLSQLARLVSRSSAWATTLPAGRPIPRVHFRPVAAGEVVLNSNDDPLSNQLRLTYGDAGAIEMESAGAAHAAHLNGALPMLTIRGISDKADGQKHSADGQGWQPVAAANAAAFALAVIAELSTADDLPAAPGTEATAPADVPHQLPVRSGALIARADYLTSLDQVLLRAGGGCPRIAVITGMAGAGKTALAVDWAHAAAEAFPDGQLYADVRGFGPDEPLPAQDILGGFLRALGRTAAVEQGSLEERAARFRTAVDGRRVLVVLDNVHSAEQIRPALPGSGTCAVLITSRERLSGLAVRYSAETIELDPLPADSAQTLLRAALGGRAGDDPAAITRLASRCGGLPLALRIAAEAVVAHPYDELASLAADLDQHGRTLDFLDTGDDAYSAVRAVFSWSYSTLDERHAEAFRLLGLHPGAGFSIHTAAALLGTGLAATRTTLRRLIGAHLLTEVGVQRFQLHDLLHEYSYELSGLADSPVTREAATRRMIEQYLHTADRAGRLIMPHRHRFPLIGDAPPVPGPAFADRAAAIRWHDQERRNLAELFRTGSAAYDVALWQLAFVLRDYYFLTKHLDDWVATHTAAVAACERLGDRRAEGITRNNLGRALLESGHLAEGAAQYEQAAHLLAERGDLQGATDSQVNLASVLRRRGRHDDALSLLRQALAFYRAAGLPRKVGITLRSIARSELSLDRLPAAAEHAQAALDEFTRLDLALDMAQTLNTLARIHHRAGHAGPAATAAHQAVEQSDRAGTDFEKARAHHTLGTVAADCGQYHLARSRWEQALTLFDRLGADAADEVRAALRRLDGLTPASPPATPPPSPERRSPPVPGDAC